MIKRLLVFLFAAAAIGGGVYVLKGRRLVRRTDLTTEPSANVAPPEALRPAPSPAPIVALEPVKAPRIRSPKPAKAPSFITAHIAVLLALASVLGGIAYAGLGQSPSASANFDRPTIDSIVESRTDPPTESDEMMLLKTDTRATAHAISAAPAPEALAAEEVPPPAAPTPAVAAEVSTPPPAPAPEREALAAPAAAFQIPADGFEAIVCSVPWPCAEAIAVAACESGRDLSGRLDGNWATNGIHYGLFQISAIHAYKWSDFYDNWMDPAHNVQWAYEIYAESGGWGPWHCKPWY